MRTAAAVALVLALAACDDQSAQDAVVDDSLGAAVWKADGEKMVAALPRTVGPFEPSEGADAFWTSYSTGPVFGAAGTYADGPRQLTVRVEGGNIRARAASLAKGGARPGESFATREVAVHGGKATLHWSDGGRTGEVVFVVQRRFVVQMRLVPAKSDDEVVRLADTVDLGPLEALALEGVGR